MKKSKTSLFKKLFVIFSAIMILLASPACFFWEFIEYFQKFSISNYTVPEESYLEPIYDFKNIDVAENENILIGTGHGIFMYNKDGKCVTFLNISDNFEFKVDKNKLLVIDYALYNSEGLYSSYNPNKFYLCSYNIESNRLVEIDEFNSSNEVNKNREEYCKQNNFIRSRKIKKYNTEYKYKFYGRVKVTKNGSSETIHLEKAYFPLSYKYILIIDGVLFAVDITFLVMFIIKKIKLRKLNKKELKREVQ